MKTLYISDLDGTLLQDDATLSGFAKGELERLIEQGVHFSIATARSPVSASPILRDVAFRCPIVLMNGVVFYDMPKKQVVKAEYLSDEAIQTVIRLLRKYKVSGFFYQLTGNELTTYYEMLDSESKRRFVAEREQKFKKCFVQADFEAETWENMIYFALLDKKERLEPVYAELGALPSVHTAFYKNTYEEDSWYLEIFSSRASKKQAVEWLRQEYGFDRIVSFGDNRNDLPMFEASDESCAVSNARQEVKEAASHQIGSNREDAVVRWIQEDWQKNRK